MTAWSGALHWPARLAWLAPAALLLLPARALAAPVAAGNTQGGADELLGRPLTLVVALAIVSLLPFLFMTTTAFVKTATTLQIVRSALGAQGVPSSTVITALAASLALLAMAPVGAQVADRVRPVLEAKQGDTLQLVAGLAEAVKEPMRAFMRANASPREKGRFLEVARRARGQGPAGGPAAGAAGAAAGSAMEPVGESDLVVLAPAFITTELYEAFALGFAVYLPFLVIDLVVANVLLALGMQQLSPTQVSMPFKLLLFVAVDGWGLLAQALVSGYRAG
jgi:type III secretion protein R